MMSTNFRCNTTTMLQWAVLGLWCGWVEVLLGAHAWILSPTTIANTAATVSTLRTAHYHHRQSSTSPSQIARHMGLLDSLSDFLQEREGDFVKLDKDDGNEYGPGPLLLLYNVPSGITNEEVYDMLSDGAPKAFAKGVALQRIGSSITQDGEEDILSQTLEAVLKGIVQNNAVHKKRSKLDDDMPPRLETDAGILATCPVLIFSGFRNDEMMVTYNLMGREIYEETGGRATAACAKAVPNAMNKPLRQVLEEITGDHMDAIQQD